MNSSRGTGSVRAQVDDDMVVGPDRRGEPKEAESARPADTGACSVVRRQVTGIEEPRGGRDTVASSVPRYPLAGRRNVSVARPDRKACCLLGWGAVCGASYDCRTEISRSRVSRIPRGSGRRSATEGMAVPGGDGASALVSARRASVT